MILWRVLPWDPAAAPSEPGGASWFPRAFQGAGRHDNPDRYGCLYLAEEAVAGVAEALAPFRGTGASAAGLLSRGGRPLALVGLELSADASLVDLDDPVVLTAAGLRPSQVATRDRDRTQRDAATLHEDRPEVAGLRWWSTLESAWISVTLFDRAAGALTVVEVTVLDGGHPAVREAAALLGLAP